MYSANSAILPAPGDEMTDGKAGWYVVALSGLISGSAVGVGVNFVGGSLKMAALCAMLGVAIGTFLYKQGDSAPNKPLIQLFKMGRSLAFGFKLFFSSIFILTICIIYSASNEIPLHTAFGLFLLPTILTVLLFDTSFDYLIPIISSLALWYFVIPPRNSFAIESAIDLLGLYVFASLAGITWATLTLQSIFSGIEEP
jgi:hypothetical protein